MVDARKTKRTHMDLDSSLSSSSTFTEPDVEAALLLIQLSSNSDHGDSLHSCSLKSVDDDDAFHVLIKRLEKEKKKKKREEEEKEQSQQLGSGYTNYSNNTPNYSDVVTSAMSATTTVARFNKDRDNDDDVACGKRRKIKKLRSLAEVYRLTN